MTERDLTSLWTALVRYFCFAMLLCGGAVRADHFSGASITYVCNGGNMYTVYLDMYVECNQTAITPQTLNFSNSCGVNFALNNLQPVLIEEVSPLCAASMPNSACNGGTLPGYRRYRFEVDLFLAPCNFWTISWSICCRNTLQNVQNIPGIYVEATLNNAGGLCDNSPVFVDSGIPYACLGNDLLYSPGAADPDGNTMVFSLIDARFLAPPPTTVNYSVGFTGAEPLPGMTIDPNTGQLYFSSAVQGNYVVVIQVSTYDANGNLIGTVMRDLMFIAVLCEGEPPSTAGLSNAVNSVVLSMNEIEVCDGLNFCADLVFTDPDPGNVISITSNIAQQLPGSTIQVNGASPATATICWTPDIALLPQTVFFNVNDGQCPIMNTTSFSILITGALPLPVAPDAGTDGNTEICATGQPADLFALLGGTPDVGGSWTDPDGNMHNGSFVPGTDAFGDYTYLVGTACENDVAVITVNEAAGSSAGESVDLSVCSVSPAVDLFASLGGAPTPGGAWQGPGGPMNGMYDPAVHDPGVYTYTIVGGPCPGASSTVTVAEITAANAGTDAQVELCDASPVTDLFPYLGAGAQAGGLWAGPSAINGNYNPAQHAPGDYVYTVTGFAPCEDASATITVIENVTPNAGMNGNLNICSNAATVDLFTILNGTPQVGGVWAGPGGIPSDGTYTPGTDVPGNYSYTILGIAPCANSTSFVIVSETAAPNAGLDAALELCDDGAPVALLTVLGGTPAANGTWTGPSNTDGTFDPQQHIAGDYVYTVTGPAICVPATATVSISVATAPDAGDDASIELCGNDAPADLFAVLEGTPQAGGMWSGPSAITGMFDPAIHVAGDYAYTVIGIAPCTDASATVTVNVDPFADAGTDAAIDVCDDSAPVDLFTVLGGTPQEGGTWNGPSVITGIYDPAVHTAGDFVYTIPGNGNCPAASATVTVAQSVSADAGQDASIAICSSDGLIDLFAELGGTPQPGGTWSGPSAITGIFDAALHFAGDYIYTVTATAPCADASATVTVTVETAPDAGLDGSITVCDAGAPVDLVGVLGGSPQAGGTWSGPSAIAGSYDPSLHDPGVYTYTLAGGANCADASAQVTVVETGTPEAGDDSAIDLCTNNGIQDLFDLLGGSPDPGGTWSGPAGAMNGMFDPMVHPEGNYTYSITAVPPCVGDQASVSISLTIAPNAGDDASVVICESTGAVNLFGSLGGSPQAGGTWTGPGGVFSGMFDPNVDPPGEYIYTITSSAVCGSDDAIVTVTVTGTPDAGDDAVIAMCADGEITDLFDQLGGTPDQGGTWSGPAAGFDGSFDPSSHPAGVYTYTIDATAPCVSDASTVTVSVEALPDAGVSTSVEFCSGESAQDLLDLLGPDASASGTWNGPSSPFTGVFDPALHIPGTYVYTITGDLCADASSSVDVSVLPGPDAGADNEIELCSSEAAFDMISQLLGTPDPGGIWTNSLGDVVNASFDPATGQSEAYTYTVAGSSGCPGATADLVITVHPAPQAGNSGTLQLCTNAGQVSLFDGLSGTLDAGGVWTDPGGVPHSTVIDPLVDPPGIYTYTVTSGVCPPAVSNVTAVIFTAPNAGEDAVAALCSTGSIVTLTALLGGSPNAGGSWIAPGGEEVADSFDPASDEPGTYTYVVAGNAACLDDQAILTIIVNTAANAGTNGDLTICGNDPPVDLSSLLGGDPDPGGTWTTPTGSIFSGLFDPSVHEGGTYTYSIQPDAPCPVATAVVVVELLPIPSPMIVATRPTGCVPAEVTIAHDYTGSASCTWILGNGVVVGDCGPVTTMYDQPGSYDITLIIDPGNGCGATTVQLEDLVVVNERPQAAFDATPDVIGTQIPAAYFHNNSEGASTYFWDMGGTGTYTTEHVTHNFPAQLGDVYEVCLIAYASPECADTICETITVSDAMVVHVPSAFTPNDDGVNEDFKPVMDGIDPERYEFIIFDRWGQELFHTNDPNAAWDGRSASGTEIQNGVYVWRISLKDEYSGKQYEETGQITLIR